MDVNPFLVSMWMWQHLDPLDPSYHLGWVMMKQSGWSTNLPKAAGVWIWNGGAGGYHASAWGWIEHRSQHVKLSRKATAGRFRSNMRQTALEGAWCFRRHGCRICRFNVRPWSFQVVLFGMGRFFWNIQDSRALPLIFAILLPWDSTTKAPEVPRWRSLPSNSWRWLGRQRSRWRYHKTTEGDPKIKVCILQWSTKIFESRRILRTREWFHLCNNAD